MAYTHATRKTIASRACPGVSFTVRRVSYGRRQAIAEQLKSVSAGEEPNELRPAPQAVGVMRALMGAMLVDVGGLELDGQPYMGRLHGDDRGAVIEELIDAAPEPLIEEIAAALLDELRLSGDAEKNSAPPSGTPPAETEGASVARNASGRGCGPAGTAAAITPIQ